MKTLLRTSMIIFLSVTVSSVFSQRLMEINALDKDVIRNAEGTIELSNTVAELLDEIDLQIQACSEINALPNVATLFSDPLFDFVYKDLKDRQKNCITSIKSNANEYIEILDLEAGRLLQSQSIYIGSGSPKSEVLDSFVIFQNRLKKSRTSLDSLNFSNAFDSLNIDFTNAERLSMTGPVFISRVERAKSNGERMLDSVKAHITRELNFLKQIRSRTEAWLKAPAKDEKSQENITGIPQIIHTDNVVTPSVTMVAGTKKVDGPWYNELGFFAGNSEERDRRNIQSIFNAEQSEYGFYLRGFLSKLGFLQEQYQSNWAVHYHFNYLEKSINEDTVQTKPSVNYSQFQGRLGAEYIVFQNILSIYAGGNWIVPLTNVNMYRERLPFQKDLQPYVDFGFRLLLQPGKELKLADDGLGIVVDVNFIVNNKDMRTVNSNNDSLVPGLRFAVQKTLTGN